MPRKPTAVLKAITKTDAAAMEVFALYGASYGTLLQAVATSPVESCPAEASAPQPKQISSRERRSFTPIVFSNREVRGPELENDTNRNRRESEVLHESTGLAGICGSPSFNTDRADGRNWLSRSWTVIASRWGHWHREREIKKAVARLAELDDRTLRDMGIPHRSQIELIVRCGRAC